MSRAWLVAIDLQQVFADSGSPWCSPDFDRAMCGTLALEPLFPGRLVRTRFVAPAEPRGAWADYYAAWPFARVPPDDPLYALVPAATHLESPIVTTTTFGKWGPELAAITGGDDLILTGVSTDCCVLSTALAAADAGIRVHVVTDACAGASADDHERALAAMALYAPLITLTTVSSLVTHQPGSAIPG